VASSAYRVGTKLPDTIEFKDAEIDQDRVLILDLRTARVPKRATFSVDENKAG